MLTVYGGYAYAVSVSTRTYWQRVNVRRTMEASTSTTKEREHLTRERVIDAALAVMDSEGLDAVSMRRVAREVGVEAMSLYTHVRAKDALLHGVCERIMSRYELPTGGDDGPDRAEAAASESWRMLPSHPS